MLYFIYCHVRGSIMVRTTRTASQGTKIQGALRRHWNNQKYDAGRLKFPHTKEFLIKFASPVRGRKLLKNIGLKVRPHVLGWPWSYFGRYIATKSFLIQGTVTN